MSYLGQRLRKRIRSRQQISMSGLTSRPTGPAISRIALGATAVEYGMKPAIVPVRRPVSGFMDSYPMTVHGPALQGPPDWFRAMQGCSLGDDAQTTGAVDLTDGTQQWQQSMLSETQGIRAAQQEFTKREELQRWVQIAATLAIPLSAAIWRAIFRGSRDSGM